MTTPFERLMAEQIPTRPRATPKPEPPPRPVQPWTAAEQDAHWAELCEGVGTPGATRPRLRIVTDDETDTEHERHSA